MAPGWEAARVLGGAAAAAVAAAARDGGMDAIAAVEDAPEVAAAAAEAARRWDAVGDALQAWAAGGLGGVVDGEVAQQVDYGRAALSYCP